MNTEIEFICGDCDTNLDQCTCDQDIINCDNCDIKINAQRSQIYILAKGKKEMTICGECFNDLGDHYAERGWQCDDFLDEEDEDNEDDEKDKEVSIPIAHLLFPLDSAGKRKRDLQISLNEKVKRFDITKMNDLPEFIGGYCLEFLSTPEKETRCPDQMEQDYLNQYNPQLQRPSAFWKTVTNHCWNITWNEKYLPLLVTNFKSKTFNRIKEIMPLIYNSLVMPKFSKSSKKKFLEQLANYHPTFRYEQTGLNMILIRFILGSRL